MVTKKSHQQFEEIFGSLSAQEVLDIVPGYIYMKDLEGAYIGANHTLGQYGGLELEGKTDFETPWKQTAEALRENDKKVMESQKQHTFIEEHLIGNRTITFLSVKAPLFDKSRNMIGIIGHSIEMSDPT